MHSDASGERRAIDLGLLSPLTVGHDATVSDAAFVEHLVVAEVALARAWARIGVAPPEAADAISDALLGRAQAVAVDVDPVQLAEDAVSGGNPVIPLVGALRERVPEAARPWVHRGATSQDIMDSAIMRMSASAAQTVLAELHAVATAARALASEYRDAPAVARTLTQHAVPTTIGLRASNWARGVERAAARLTAVAGELPAQLGGAGGTLASFVAIGGIDAAAALPAAYATELGLAAPEAPWHTQRWPVTELGDALVQAVDALGKVAADVATLSRTEIGEVAESAGGGSSAMPQKRNPATSVLIRSAAIRAPHLAATLHSAAALMVDERPDGAWHAEWPALRELLRLALGASAAGARLVSGLRVDPAAALQVLARTHGLVLSERLAIELGPMIGAERVRELVAAAGAGADLATLLRAEPALAGVDLAALLDPAQYTGLAHRLVDARVDAPTPSTPEETP